MNPEHAPSPDELLDGATDLLRDRPIPPGPSELHQTMLINLLQHRQGLHAGHLPWSLWKSRGLRLAIAAMLLLMFAGPLFRSGVRQEGVAFGDSLYTAQMKVDLLRMFYDLQATPDQLRALQRIAANTQAPAQAVELPPDSHAKDAASYPQALAALHEALLSNDDEKIEAAETQVDDIAEKFDIDDVDVTATPTARGKAEEALRLFNAAQIAGYIAQHSEDVEDPTQVLIDALTACRAMATGEFPRHRDEIAKKVALLVAGIDPRRGDPVSRKVIDLLDRARSLNGADFDTHRAELEESARLITGSVNSFEVLQHWMLGSMAKLLSNPQLGNALSERLQHPAPHNASK